MSSNDQMERLARSLSNTSRNIPMEQAVQALQQLKRDILLQMADPNFQSALCAAVKPGINAIAQAAKSIGESNELRTGILTIHRSWLSTYHDALLNSAKSIKPLLDSCIADSLRSFTISQSLLADYASSLNCLSNEVARSIFSDLDRPLANFVASYGDLFASAENTQRFLELPSFAFPSASRELLATSLALDVAVPCESTEGGISETDKENLAQEIEQQILDLPALLEERDETFLNMYLGARQALEAGNPDRIRHFLLSSRQLVDSLLEHLAPDKEVLAWLGAEPKTSALHEGRPNRRVRLSYISRGLNSPATNAFIETDAKVLSQMFKCFNRLHESEPGLSDIQAWGLFRRTESFLYYILQLATLQ